MGSYCPPTTPLTRAPATVPIIAGPRGGETHRLAAAGPLSGRAPAFAKNQAAAGSWSEGLVIRVMTARGSRAAGCHGLRVRVSDSADGDS